jgi:hypothetical protein
LIRLKGIDSEHQALGNKKKNKKRV